MLVIFLSPINMDSFSDVRAIHIQSSKYLNIRKELGVLAMFHGPLAPLAIDKV